MGSPTKKKFHQAVQQEILTNYYLNKYDRFMTRFNNGQYSPKPPG